MGVGQTTPLRWHHVGGRISLSGGVLIDNENIRSPGAWTMLDIRYNERLMVKLTAGPILVMFK